MITTFSLPIVIIFERHWDVVPKKLFLDMLPKLASKGYDTYCFEGLPSLSEKQIVEAQKIDLEGWEKIHSLAKTYLKNVNIELDLTNTSYERLCILLQLYVTSTKYDDLAYRIRNLNASTLLHDIFMLSQKHFFSIKGIDHEDGLLEIGSAEIWNTLSPIKKNEERRISSFTENLISLHKKGKGVIFSSGASHAYNLMLKMKKENYDQNVLYYFPHSDKNWCESLNDVDPFRTTTTLKDHTFCIKTEGEFKTLEGRILNEIESKNVEYSEEVHHSLCDLLSQIFQKQATVFMRPGYYVDALIEHDPKDTIIDQLSKIDIKTTLRIFSDKTYLIIPEINTRGVGEKLFGMK